MIRFDEPVPICLFFSHPDRGTGEVTTPSTLNDYIEWFLPALHAGGVLTQKLGDPKYSRCAELKETAICVGDGPKKGCLGNLNKIIFCVRRLNFGDESCLDGFLFFASRFLLSLSVGSNSALC